MICKNSGGRRLGAVGLVVVSVVALLVPAARAAHYVAPPFAIADGTTKQDQPAVAFDGSQFLAVYTFWGAYDTGAPKGSIYGTLIDPTSQQVNTFPIELSMIYNSSCSAPAVAFDTDNIRYLVAFEDHRPEFTDTDMSAKLLDANGNELAQTVLAFSVYDDVTPDVAYIGNGTFVVVWCEVTDRTSPTDGVIRANTVTFDGTDLILGPIDHLVNESATFNYLGAARPKVAANTAGKSVVVWQWLADGSNPDPATWQHDIQARVLAEDGQPLGTVCSIASTTDDEAAACISYDSYDDQFLAAWQDLRVTSHHDILGTMVHIDANDAVTTGPILGIATGPQDDTWPAVCWNSGLHEFQVAWQGRITSSNHDIFGCQVEPDGTVRREFAVTRRGAMEGRPALARGLDRMLAVWEDEVVGVTASDVYGAYVLDRAPPPHVLAVTPALVTVLNKSAGLKTIQITFDQDMPIAATDITVVGKLGGARSDFALSFDPVRFIATLTWTTPLPNDTYVVTVRDSLKNSGNLALDGEMSAYSPLFPSGDGTAGGNFVGLVYRLTGDANRDRNVNVFDLQIMALSWNKVNGQPGYDARADFNEDNRVNVFDLQILAANWNKTIPKGP